MTPPGAVVDLRHSVLGEEGGAAPPEARLTDRQRLGVIFQGAALLALLEESGWRLPQGWRPARVSAGGALRLPTVEPGRSGTLPQAYLRQFLLELFGGGETVAGRGQGRRSARFLLEIWRQDLTPVSAGRAVEQILQAAPFLWEPSFGEARRALSGMQQRGRTWDLWLAGSGSFRRRLRRALISSGNLSDGDEKSFTAAQDLLASAEGKLLWHPSPPPSMSSIGPAKGLPPGASFPAPRVRAQLLFDQGLFEQALELLGKSRAVEAQILRARCQLSLGNLLAAQKVVQRLEPKALSSRETVAIAEVALRLLGHLGDLQGQSRWLERILRPGESAGAAQGWRAHIAAASAAWDRGDSTAMDRHLEASKGAQDDAHLGWRWRQTKGMRAMMASDGAQVIEHLAAALRQHRRRLRPFEAGGLWNDLGMGRALEEDLAGAEKAFAHCQRLLRRCEGPRGTTLGLFNLAEIRLRRGRLPGVRRALEDSTARNRRDGNLRGAVEDEELWTRYELALGRPGAALHHARAALQRLEKRGEDWHRGELLALSARALGWLGRREEAASHLENLSEAEFGLFEPEEKPALWALAGRREEALEAASGTPFHHLWQALLMGESPVEVQWNRLEELEPYRAARLVYDAEAVTPGSPPARWRRRAIEVFHRLGALSLAERLEASDGGPWVALARYASKPAGDLEALATLFGEAGYSEAQLFWQGEVGGLKRRYQLVEGEGGAKELSAVLEDGRLGLRAPRVDGPLEALFALAVRDFEPPQEEETENLRGRGGILGESPLLLAALRRTDKFARSEVPVLILGETGTGKELFARRLHRLSSRADGSFLPLNCAALSEQLVLSELFGHVKGAFTGADRDRAGIFETARGGVIFLDEIGDLPLSAQGMLLRVLQEGEVRRLGESLPRRVDVRIVTATHRNLMEMVADGLFRQDLLYRLKVGFLDLPPLRDRGHDVVLLAERFSSRLEPPIRLSREAKARLLSHSWPGNVRELENVISVAAALADGDGVEAADLEIPNTRLSSKTDYHASIEAFRKRLLMDALRESPNQSAAAERLGLTRQTLSYWIRQLAIKV